MNIENFKQSILDKDISDDLVIFVYSDNTFIINSYINAICEQKNLSKNFVGSLSETNNSALSLVFDYSSDLSILVTENFNEVFDDYSEFKNCVVICKKVDPLVKEAASDYIIDVPKQLDWQVKAYMKALCAGLTDKAIDWLYDACCKDINKIDNELIKLSLIDTTEQTDALRDLCQNKDSDLFIKESVFKLVDALIIGDKKTAYSFLQHASYYSTPYTGSDGKKERDLDPVGLVSLVLAKLKNNLLINYSSGVSLDDLGLSKGAAYYIRQQLIPLDKLKHMINFLSNIDGRLKTNPSSLDFIGCRKTALLEYIIVNMLSFSK